MHRDLTPRPTLVQKARRITNNKTPRGLVVLWRRPSVVHPSTLNLAYGPEEQPAKVDCITHTRLPPSLKARAIAAWRDRVHSAASVSLAAPS